jgi:hypothetical protein
LSGLRKQVAALMLPDEVEVVLSLDKLALLPRAAPAPPTKADE